MNEKFELPMKISEKITEHLTLFCQIGICLKFDIKLLNHSWYGQMIVGITQNIIIFMLKP